MLKMFTTADYLRRQVDRCLRLAEQTSNPKRQVTLASLAQVYGELVEEANDEVHAQQPGKPKPPGNPPRPSDPDNPMPVEEPPSPIPVPLPSDEPPPMHAEAFRDRPID
jgi:hypothetical protein